MEIVISGNEKGNSLTPFKFSQPISPSKVIPGPGPLFKRWIALSTG